MSKWIGLIPAGAWEYAFLKIGVPNGLSDFEAIVSSAAHAAGVEISAHLERDDEEDIVLEIVDAFHVGSVDVDFPDSQHGDGLSVSVSRFPEGTAVGQRWSTWERRRIVFVLPNATMEHVEEAVSNALDEARDGAEWNLQEEGDEEGGAFEDGITACSDGFEKLRAAWKPRLRKSATARRTKDPASTLKPRRR